MHCTYSRVFHRYKFSLFVNGDENVAVYGPYKANEKIIMIIDAFPLNVLYIQRKGAMVSRDEYFILYR